jgi:hypothetical protein
MTLRLVHSHRASRQTPLGRLVRLSKQLAFPKYVKVVRSTDEGSLCTTHLHGFARIALGLDKAKTKRGRHTCIISGSFPLDVNKQTQQACASPPTPNPPRSLGFSCALHAYTRLHAPRMPLLSDVLFSERLARQGPIPPSIVLRSSLVLSIT